MSLPGLPWLREKLAATDAVGGGYQAKMGQPVQGGAAFQMTVIFVFAWLLALPVMLAWNGLHRSRRPAAGRR